MPAVLDGVGTSNDDTEGSGLFAGASRSSPPATDDPISDPLLFGTDVADVAAADAAAGLFAAAAAGAAALAALGAAAAFGSLYAPFA